MRAALLGALALLAPALAGCVNPAPPVREASDGPAWSLELPITVNVVLVGFDGRLDPARLAADLPATRPVYNLGEFGATRTAVLEPIQYRLSWRFHEAPEAFAEAFFGAAEQASFEGPAPAFLVNYDRDSGQQRFPAGPLDATPLAGVLGGLAHPPSPTTHRMAYIDAPTLERWVHDHRADFGLAFEEPEYTFFLVDSYTNGYLPQDGYHYYYFDDGTIDADLDRARPTVPLGSMAIDEFHTPKDPTSNRGWGGKWDFAWIDVGAAPSWLDYQPWVPAFEDDNVDHPVWDLAGQEEKLHRNLARHLADAAYVKILRTPIYDFEVARQWAFPVTVFVEGTAVSGERLPTYGEDVETWLLPERIEAAFEELAPWVDTLPVEVTYRHLPQDDPGMHEAIEKAKAHGAQGIVSAGFVKDYVRQHYDEYVPSYGPEVRVFPQFLFYFDGLWTFWGPNQGGGWADSDGWGRPWVAFDHIFDVCVKAEEFPCTKGTKWSGDGSMDMLVIHEGGHHVGLTHARDTAMLNEDGADDEYRSNWFWDSVWSVMTYRHQFPAFDQYDRDVVARGHVAWLLPLVAERAAALGASPEAERAEQAILAAERLLLAGDWAGAARAAVAAWQGVQDAELLRAASWQPQALLETEVEGFGDVARFAASPGVGGFPRVPDVFPEGSPLSVWARDLEVREGAAYVHLAYRDTRPDAGPLRMAFLVLLGPDEKYAGGAFDDVFAESFITGLRGPGTYRALLLTNGGLASEYEVTLDVHYPAG